MYTVFVTSSTGNMKEETFKRYAKGKSFEDTLQGLQELCWNVDRTPLALAALKILHTEANAPSKELLDALAKATPTELTAMHDKIYKHVADLADLLGYDLQKRSTEDQYTE